MREKLILTCILFFCLLKSYAQNTAIAGKVIDAQERTPLAGVTVYFTGEGHNTSVSTDEMGRFALPLESNTGKVTLTLIGYVSQEVTYTGQPLADILLEKEETSLDEVVVVGYGTVRKRDLTGSVVSVKGDEIAKVPSANIIESVQGKIPGVDITRSNGSASSGVAMTVRGNRSITAQNGPLFIVDGVQYSNIQDINPNDIESMEVLKDASSTAIYGSRGANGVVIITTKKGSTGRARIAVNSYVGVSKIDRYPTVMNLDQWVNLRREAYRTVDRWNAEEDDPQAFNNAELEAIRNNEYIDYFDLLVRDGMQQNYQISVNAGNEKTTVYFSGDYLNERGLFDMDMTNRFGGRLNIDQKLGGIFQGWYAISRDEIRD